MKSNLYEVQFIDGVIAVYWAKSFKEAMTKAEKHRHVRPRLTRLADPIESFNAIKRKKIEANF